MKLLSVSRALAAVTRAGELGPSETAMDAPDRADQQSMLHPICVKLTVRSA